MGRTGRHPAVAYAVNEDVEPPSVGDLRVPATADASRPTPDVSAVTRPLPTSLAQAHERTIPDVIAPGLTVLFCGINPGLWSAAVGQHFARPGNRFWPALHRGGFTPRRLRPDEQGELLRYGLGITNLVARGTARADGLTADELVAGGRLLVTKLRRYRPDWLAVLGVGAYRVAFNRRKASIGPQEERLGGARVWVLPNPSGLNASYQMDRLVQEFSRLRAAAFDELGRATEDA